MRNSAGFNFGIFTNLDFGPSAELRKTNTSNYGKTKIGECNYDELYGLDIGYSKRLYKYLKLGAEISVGYECETRYSKYSDERFTEGYYLSEEEKDSNYLVGIGGIIIIPFNNRFELISSYNSIKGISGGIMVRF